MNVEVTYNQSYFDKTNSANYISAIEEVINNITQEATDLCMDECPVDTGLLRDSHDYDVGGFVGQVTNSTDYWIYVVYGTYKSSANNYPQRVVGRIISSNSISDNVNSILSGKGIL